MAVKRQAKNAVKITAPLQGRGQTIAGLGRPLRPTRPRLTVSQAINQGRFSRVQKEFLKSRMENPNCISRWIARGTSIIKRKQTFSKASPSAVALLPPSPRLRRTRWRDKFRLRQGSGATSPPSLRFRLRRGFRFLGPPEPPGGRGGLNFGSLASPCSPRNLFNHHQGQTQSAPTRMVRVHSREFAFIRVYKNKNMRKREPSKLDPFADKLDQW